MFGAETFFGNIFISVFGVFMSFVVDLSHSLWMHSSFCDECEEFI
jgi:hypothetical protein